MRKKPIHSRASRLSGWSLIELTIILIVLAILTAILAPVIGRYVAWAKIIRAREDVQMLGSAIWMFLHDTGKTHFLEDGDDETSDTVEVLVSDGHIPACPVPTQAAWWAEVVQTADHEVDFFENHLSINDPYGGGGGPPTASYLTPFDIGNVWPAAAGIGPGGIAGPWHASQDGAWYPEFAWRGPYINNPVDPDPWNNRYMASVKWLDPAECLLISQKALENDVIVISAGPDETTHTYFNGIDQEADLAIPSEGIATLGDDIVFIVTSNANE